MQLCTDLGCNFRSDLGCNFRPENSLEAGLKSNFGDLTISSNETPQEKSDALENINKEARALAGYMNDKSLAGIEPLEETNYSTPTKVVFKETHGGNTVNACIKARIFAA